MIEIKIATPNDTEIISLLGRITFSQTFEKYFTNKQDLLNYLDKTFAVDKIKNSLCYDKNIYFIAYFAKLPIGYAKLKLDSLSEFVKGKRICQLQKIYLLSDFLAVGAGKVLGKTLLEKAISLGYEYIWLSVLDANHKAIGFYNNEQFIKIGEHTFQIGSQSFNFLAMGKKLSDV
jgi:diamine N-acetyltransferase